MIGNIVVVVGEFDPPFLADDEGARHLHGILPGGRGFHEVALLAGLLDGCPYLAVQESLEQVAALEAVGLVGLSFRVGKDKKAWRILLCKLRRCFRYPLHDDSDSQSSLLDGILSFDELGQHLLALRAAEMAGECQ